MWDKPRNKPLIYNPMEIARKEGLFENAQFLRLVLGSTISGDRGPLAEIMKALTPAMLFNEYVDPNPFRPYPRGHEVDGYIRYGVTDETRATVGADNHEIASHTGIFGASGEGKTQTCYVFALGLHQKGIPFFWPDLKRDARHLKRVLPEGSLHVMRWNQLRLNPPEPPPNVLYKEWMQDLSDVFAQSFGYMVGSQSYFLEHLDRLYRLKGVDKGSTDYPTFYELYQLLRNTSYKSYSRDARFHETNLGRIKVLLSAIGDVLNCSHGIPLEELCQRNWVLELDGLAGYIQTFLINVLLLRIFKYRIARNERGGLRQVAIFDEGQRIFDRNLETSLKEISIIDQMTAMVREFGLGIIVSTQEPSKLTNSFLANSYTKIAFSLRNGRDIEEAAKCMSLTKEQAEYFNRLERGQAIVRTGKYERPFTVRIPFIPIDKNVSDEELW
jgi:hypothetical protein